VASSPTPLFALAVAGGTVGVPGRGARYRGYVEATAAAGPLRLVNTVDVEDYLRGMGEVRDPRWPAASLQAQAVAARTYALRAMAVNGEICDTQRCQVYLGQQAEYPQMDAAVAATRGWVVGAGGGLASTVYSASAGGWSATTAEGFGTPDGAYPYLRAAPHPTPDPRPWSRTIALADVAARLGYPGRLTDVRVPATGPSGRALAVELAGSDGVRTVTGVALGRALGLPSTRWTVRVAAADAAPPPPPPPEDGAAVQALPEEVGAVIARDVAAAAAAGDGGGGGGAPDLPGWFVGGLVAVVVAAGLAGAWTLLRAERGR
jgi:stage II sporulation protein D